MEIKGITTPVRQSDKKIHIHSNCCLAKKKRLNESVGITHSNDSSHRTPVFYCWTIESEFKALRATEIPACWALLVECAFFHVLHHSCWRRTRKERVMAVLRPDDINEFRQNSVLAPNLVKSNGNMRFEVFRQGLWSLLPPEMLTQFILVDCFGGICCFHLRGRKILYSEDKDGKFIWFFCVSDYRVLYLLSSFFLSKHYLPSSGGRTVAF